MGRVRGEAPFRVLLVGPSALVEAQLVLERAGIGNGHVAVCDSVAQAVGVLADHPADAVLLDMSIADGAGWASITRLQAIAPGVPVLPFTSAAPAPGLAESAVPWGGEPGNGLLDLPYAIACLRRAADKREADRKLLHVATHDRLTGLANRWLLEERLKRALARSRRTGSGGALVFADLDGFKSINDRFGHDVGDVVLTTIAHRLSRALRETDTVGRFGGDEFLVVLERVASRDNALRVTTKIARLIAAPVTVDAIEVEVGASMGTAVFPEDGEDVPTLLRVADQAMFKTKRQRRVGAAAI